MVRFKNRWFLVQFLLFQDSGPKQIAVDGLDGRQIWTALKQSVLINFGDTGWGAVGSSLNVKYYSPTTHICIIRVASEHYRITWAAITFLSGIEGQRLIPNVIHVSGTIKHAQLAAIAHNREIVARYRAQASAAAQYHDSYGEYLETSTADIDALQD